MASNASDDRLSPSSGGGDRPAPDSGALAASTGSETGIETGEKRRRDAEDANDGQPSADAGEDRVKRQKIQMLEGRQRVPSPKCLPDSQADMLRTEKASLEVQDYYCGRWSTNSFQIHRAIAARVSLLVQSINPDLKDAQRIAKFTHVLQFHRLVQPTIPAQGTLPLRDRLSGTGLPGRRLESRTRGHDDHKNRWNIRFRDIGDTKLFRATLSGTPTTNTITVPYILLPRNTAAVDIDAAVEDIRICLEHWPLGELDLSNRRHAILLGHVKGVALAHKSPAHPLLAEMLVGRSAFYINVTYIDAQTGNAVQKLLKINVATARRIIRAPYVPDSVLTETIGHSPAVFQALGDGNMTYAQWPPAWPNFSQAKRRRVQDVLRYIALQLHGLITTKARINELFDIYCELLETSSVDLPEPHLPRNILCTRSLLSDRCFQQSSKCPSRSRPPYTWRRTMDNIHISQTIPSTLAGLCLCSSA